MTDQLRMVSQVSAMFAALEDDTEKSIEQRVRFYKTVHGITFPDDWTLLPLEEKKQRLDLLDKTGLELSGTSSDDG